MYENQQPSVTQELGTRGESSELLRVGAGESSASATDTNNTTFATRSTQNGRLKKYGNQKQHQRNH